MNRAVFVTILVFICCQLTGQKTTSIVGKWKIVSYSDEVAYFRFKNDSIAIKDRGNIEDSLYKKQLFASAKMVYGSIEIEFLKDGTYILKMDTVLILKASFKAIPLKNIIQLTSKNSLNEDVTDIIKYSIQNGFLNLNLKWEDQQIDLVLERLL